MPNSVDDKSESANQKGGKAKIENCDSEIENLDLGVVCVFTKLVRLDDFLRIGNLAKLRFVFFFVFCLGFLRVDSRKRNCTIAMRIRKIGLDSDGIVEVANGALEFVFFRKCEAAIVERYRIIRLDF